MREDCSRLIFDAITSQVDVCDVRMPEIVKEVMAVLDEDTGESYDMIVDEGETEIEE